MPTTEIDDIFSGKVVSIQTSAKRKADSLTATDGSNTLTANSNRKKKKKKKTDDGDVHVDASYTTKSSGSPAKNSAPKETKDIELSKKDVPVATTVHDPSVKMDSKRNASRYVDRHGKTAATKAKSKVGKTKGPDAGEDDEDTRFRDSRGTGPRRKTEEGFSIYKEDELGIKDGGGDTPLCPFDCDCCF